MDLFEHPEFRDHERVLFRADGRIGLRAIVAIHDTTLGPAAGGCRMVAYPATEAAVADVLRLSRGMTYKNALAGLPLGGGKAVVLGDPRAPGKQTLLEAFASFVASLRGDYWTAIDVGVGGDDARLMSERCPYVFARGDRTQNRGDTSYFTALGGFVGIRASVAHALGSPDLGGKRVAIQGCGATGSYLAGMLAEAGAELVCADVHAPSAQRLADQHGAAVVAPDAIYDQEVDVFAPCALGAIINDDTVRRLRARVVCGLANNQLARDEHGEALRQREILYAPDYVANAGGIIYSSDEIFGENDEARARRRIDGIAETLQTIFERAAAERVSPHRVADALAVERLAAGRAGETP